MSNSKLDGFLTSDVWIGCNLQRSQPVANDENGSTKATKGPIQNARLGGQCYDSVKRENANEDRLVAIMSEDLIRMTRDAKGYAL
jgi:hypothetical protein